MSKRLVSVHRGDRVEHYALSADGDLLLGVAGYMQWNGDVPGAGWGVFESPTLPPGRGFTDDEWRVESFRQALLVILRS